MHNNEKEIINQNSGFLTELKLVKSSSSSKLVSKLELATLEENIIRRAKSKSRSPNKKKKKKRGRKYQLLYLDKLYKKAKGDTTKKNNYEHKFKVIFGKIVVKKKYLKELANRKKVYSEQIKKIKIIKRVESFHQKEDSSFDLIKKYSLKVLNTNRANINNKREKEKELFEKLGIIDKNNLNSAFIETPQINQKMKLNPILSKMNIINNNLTPIISYNKMITNRNNNIIKEENKTNFPLNNNNFNLRKKYEMNKLQSTNKKDSLNISTPIVPVKQTNKRINNRNNKSNLQIILSNTTKTEMINKEKSIDNTSKVIDKIIEINDSGPKKVKKEREDLCKDLHVLYYAIVPGNASYLIKNCMLHRTNWKESYSYVTNLFNFKWVQSSQGLNYLSLGKFASFKQIVNHFENHSCISNKGNLFINMMNYCEQRKISVFKYIPLTMIFNLKMLEDIKNEKTEKKLEKIKKFVDEDELKFIKKYEDIGKYFREEEYLEEKKRRKEIIQENFIQKNKILYYVKETEGEKSEDEINNCEEKYILYKNYFGKIKSKEKLQSNITLYNRDKERQKLAKSYIGENTVIELPNTHSSGKNMWVIKPMNLNRGMCIKIVNNYKKMMYILNKFKEGVNYNFTSKTIEEVDKKPSIREKIELRAPIYNCDKIIIQKYIEKPLLYKGRKFDMRVWVLVTQNLKVYFFKEGHLKTCSITFDINSKNAYTHITNYSFQKYNEYFQKYEKGNEVPFYEFQKFIDEEYPEKNYKVKIDLYSQIKEIVSISMKSVKEQIDKNNNSYQFEIFGYDFMLDENFNLFLIEVNTNPGLEESSPWIQIIVPRMLDDALRLTIDQLFNPEYDFSKIYQKDKKENNLKIILNNFRDKVEFDNKRLKTDNDIIKKDINKEFIETTEMKTISNDTEELIEKINKKSDVKIELNKNDKYISPFPIPGYKNDENLWEFVCDLTSKDPLDKFLDKEEDIRYTGIRYLFNKKKNNEK